MNQVHIAQFMHHDIWIDGIKLKGLVAHLCATL